ncbi:sugar 3,4-ketoisomerase [Carboxylicivirga linearis]|uniref:WxcM-like domain-containing protein n=1 Tax=Carboxylicivirga linearis TaxID=1628157 RepID=A0ABS5JTN9_9BACT|nr:FdtA/QdtA family cupin domain-containing protein [Carboxylicivirga linearis]MBS2098227.1 WxcM-like domain-containing protein [Carboxylicivirga linearis]
MSDDSIKLISLPKIVDLRGNLSFLEDNNQIPFKIARSYWIYDVPGGEERGGHAYTNSAEFVIPLIGSLQVELYQGDKKQTYTLNTPNKGLYLPKLTWRKVCNFLSGSICLIISDTYYNDCEYIRDFNTYINRWKKEYDDIN